MAETPSVEAATPRLDRFLRRLLIAGFPLLAGCYPPYTKISPPPLLYKPDTDQLLQPSVDRCWNIKDAAAQELHDANAAKHEAAVVGSTVTLITGGTAGGLGAGASAETKLAIPSGISGALSLGAGIVTIVMVVPGRIEAAQKTLDERQAQWNAVNNGVTELYGATDATAANKAIDHLKTALFKCGAEPTGAELKGLADFVDQRFKADVKVAPQ